MVYVLTTGVWVVKIRIYVLNWSSGWSSGLGF